MIAWLTSDAGFHWTIGLLLGAVGLLYIGILLEVLARGPQPPDAPL